MTSSRGENTDAVNRPPPGKYGRYGKWGGDKNPEHMGKHKDSRFMVPSEYGVPGVLCDLVDAAGLVVDVQPEHAV
eukprot:499276-Pyramimonas_sp.AAC.1